MPTINEAVARNQKLIAEGKNLVSVPAESESQAGPMPPAQVTGLPVRGVYTPNQIMSPDFLANTSAMRTGPNLRSATFPPAPQSPAANDAAAQSLAAKQAALEAKAFASESANAAVLAVDPNTGVIVQQPISTLKTTATAVSLDNMRDGLQTGRTAQAALTGNFIDPSKSGVLAKGSTPFTTGAGFSYQATTTSITWTWKSLVLYRADGTLTAVPDGLQAVTGLVAGTIYYFYPYWREPGNGLASGLQWVSTGAIPMITGVEFTTLTSGYVSTTTHGTPNSTALSIELWCRNTTGADGVLVQHSDVATGTPGSTDFAVLQAGGVIRANVNGTLITGVTVVDDSNWHHVAVTLSGTTISIYVDGVLDKTGTATYTPAAGYWRISSNQGDVNNHVIGGEIADVAIYDGTVINAGMVAQDYTALAGGGTQSFYESTVLGNAGLTYFWKLTEGSGTTAADSQDSNTGTYQGTFTLAQSFALSTANGSPAYAWLAKNFALAQVQNLQGNVPLSDGGMAAATPATGTGGGSGGGGGGGRGTI